MKKRNEGNLKSINQKTLDKNLEKYQGSILMTVDDQIYVTKKPKNVHRIIKEIEKKYHKQPVISVIPKGDLLIV